MIIEFLIVLLLFSETKIEIDKLYFSFHSRISPVLNQWETEKLRAFIGRLNIGYSKLYDVANQVYLYVNRRGFLQTATDDSGAPWMYWTRSGDNCIENIWTGEIFLSVSHPFTPQCSG